MDHHISCNSAGGKSNIFHVLKDTKEEEVCIIADGAAIGPEMNRLYSWIEKNRNCHLYLPESFEWIILKSGLIEDKEIQMILENPEDYIDSKLYFSWERYFTKILVEKTKDSYLKYSNSICN